MQQLGEKGVVGNLVYYAVDMSKAVNKAACHVKGSGVPVCVSLRLFLRLHGRLYGRLYLRLHSACHVKGSGAAGCLI